MYNTQEEYFECNNCEELVCDDCIVEFKTNDICKECIDEEYPRETKIITKEVIKEVPKEIKVDISEKIL